MEEKLVELTSPVMGTFYRASTPGGAPLAVVGQKIQASDIVCVVESMKIFTELRSECSGIVRKILVENEEPVMKRQPLMVIEKE